MNLHFRCYSVAALLLVAWGVCASPQSNPSFTIDDRCSAIAYAKDGRIAFATRNIYRTRNFDMQRDHIWVADTDGKRKRIVNGEKLVRGNAPFSYSVQSIRWSPDGTRLTVELLTSLMLDERGNTKERTATLLLDESGKEIKIEGADSVIWDSLGGAWLNDGVTVAYTVEAVPPRLLSGISTVRPISALGSRAFERHTFAAVDWDAQRSAAAAVERDRNLSGPPRLVWLDLLKETRRELAVLDGYVGGLTVSPSGMKVAYFRDPETLEIRRLDDPAQAVRVSVGMGTYVWAPGESYIVIKRGSPKASGNLARVSLPDGKLELILSALTFREFVIDTAGRHLAVTAPNGHIQVYTLP